MVMLDVPTSGNGEIVSQPPGGRWEIQTITTRPSLTFSDPGPIPRGGAVGTGSSSQRNYDVMPDGRMLAVIATRGSRLAGTGQIHVVLNWFEELRSRIPFER